MKQSCTFATSWFAGLLAFSMMSFGCAGPAGKTGAGDGGAGGGGGGANSGGTTSSATSSGGVTSSGGSSNTGGSGGSGGTTTSGGSSGPDASISSGGSSGAGGASGGSGGTSNSGTSGGTTSSGGTSSGGTTSGGGTSDTGGNTGSGGATDAGPPPVSYMLPPPDRCHDQDFIPYDYNAKTGCLDGDTTTACGGKCQVINACSESTTSKPHADVTFMCPRNLLFSPEMEQAVADDGLTGFHYAVVGHDVDKGGIDGQADSACCQCYQLVFSLPENVAQVGGNGAAAIPIPPPLVVQSFNTSAGGGRNFDVFMGAGGFGAFNACDPNASMTSASGKYLYTQFPPEGEPGAGGVNAATQLAACKGTDNLVSTESLSSTTCQAEVATSCGKFKSSSTTMTNESITSCTQSNQPDSYYHMNWKIYAKRVECPTHLIEVTGCKLAAQGLDPVNPAVMTPGQAAADSSFKSGYTITTMQDCCMPTCAWQNNVKGQNVPVVGDYNSFYSCDQNGVAVTAPPDAGS